MRPAILPTTRRARRWPILPFNRNLAYALALR